MEKLRNDIWLGVANKPPLSAHNTDIERSRNVPTWYAQGGLLYLFHPTRQFLLFGRRSGLAQHSRYKVKPKKT
jgi:hypothetical protein